MLGQHCGVQKIWVDMHHGLVAAGIMCGKTLSEGQQHAHTRTWGVEEAIALSTHAVSCRVSMSCSPISVMEMPGSPQDTEQQVSEPYRWAGTACSDTA